MMHREVAAALVMLAALAPAARAQNAGQERVAALKTELARNAAEQRKYTWIETTQMAYEGEVKSTEAKSCQYVQGSNTPTCTLVGAPAEPKKVRGPLRKSIAKSKTEELKTYMDSVKALVARYVPLEQGRIQAAQGRGDVSVAPNPSNNTVKLVISNYLEKGDAATVVVHQATNHLAGLSVNTWLNDPGATVTLAVDFVTLPNGVSFPKQKTLTATAKKIVVTITSSNYAQAVPQ
jgi:hypothetical protein